MGRSWEVRVATGLVGLGVVPGLASFVLADRLLHSDPSFLFILVPILLCFLVGAGLMLVAGAGTLAVRLHLRRPLARLQTGVFGSVLVLVGLFVLGTSTPAGLVLLGYGAVLVWLMTRPGAARDLGSWTEGARPPAPWGSTPGTAIWSSAPVQQGPWSPMPTSLPWLSWKGVSGPHPPWWRTWQAGLERGLPLWEAAVLAAALLTFFVALGLLATGARAWSVLLLPLAFVGVMVVEQRMRVRLERGRGRPAAG